jgi:hypothetical protein
MTWQEFAADYMRRHRGNRDALRMASKAWRARGGGAAAMPVRENPTDAVKLLLIGGAAYLGFRLLKGMHQAPAPAPNPAPQPPPGSTLGGY